MDPLVRAAILEAEARGFNAALDTVREIIGSASTTVDAAEARAQVARRRISGPYAGRSRRPSSRVVYRGVDLGEMEIHGPGGVEERISLLLDEAHGI